MAGRRKHEMESEASAVEAALAQACGSGRAGAVAPLIPRGAAVLVACSGGADSTALAGALVELARLRPELGLRIALGHVDHGLRAESAAEARGVRALAASLGVPFFLETLDADRLRSAIAQDGLEGAARDHRYRALARLALEARCALVATAHTRRDQAETVLLRLARGGGLGALAGVRARRPLAAATLVRPLLGVPREATEAWCRARDILYTNDSHNFDPARSRARVRAALAQLAGLLNPRLEEALAGAARIAADEDAFLERQAADALAAALVAPAPPAPATPPGGEPVSNLEMPVLPAPDPTRDQPAWRAAALALLPDPLLRRALLLAARQRGARPERPHVELLCALVRAGRGSLDLPGGRGAILGGILRFQIGNARASSRVAPAGPPALTIPGPGRYAWEALRLEVFAPADSGARPAALACTVDLERAPFPWTLRAHRPGDRFRPARGHLKKVSELWIDAKLPRARRATLPLLADASGALFWVAGLRPGAAALPPRTMSVSLRFETDGGPLFELPSGL